MYRHSAREAQNESRKVRRHHEYTITKRWKIRTSGKWHIRKPLSPQSQPSLHRKIQAQSKTYTCEIPLAPPWPCVHSENKHLVRKDILIPLWLPPIGYSLFYTLVYYTSIQPTPHTSLLHPARQYISTPSCTCPIPVAQVKLYKIQKPTQKSVWTTSLNLAPYPSPTPLPYSTTNSTSQSNKKNSPTLTSVITLLISKTRISSNSSTDTTFSYQLNEPFTVSVLMMTSGIASTP